MANSEKESYDIKAEGSGKITPEITNDSAESGIDVAYEKKLMSVLVSAGEFGLNQSSNVSIIGI